MDYIFIIGPSAVGKTTLAKGLFEHYRGVLLEQNMVPEFAIPDQIDDPGPGSAGRDSGEGVQETAVI